MSRLRALGEGVSKATDLPISGGSRPRIRRFLARFSAPHLRTVFSRPHEHLRLAIGLCVFTLAYYLAFKFSVDQATKVPSPFWLPNCFLLCALLRSQPRHWWLIFLITVPIRLTDNVIPAHPVWYRLGATAISIVQALAGAWAFRLIAPNPDQLVAQPAGNCIKMIER